MGKLFQIIEYLFFRFLIEIFRFVPFFLLYRIADFFALIFILVGYRKKVILTNLKNSFPEKDKKFYKKVLLKFYQHLADILLESVKGYTMPKKQFLKRYKIVNPEVDKYFFDKNLNVIYVGGHYGNWEWGTQATPFILLHKVVILYKPLKNPYIDKFIKNRRERFGVSMVSIKLTDRSFQKFNKPYCVIMVSDQNPSNKKRAIWTKFLNQDTAVLHGLELYAKRYDFPVVFFDTQKVKRGFYQIKLTPITETPRDLPKGELTQKFMTLLEQAIKREPYYWLWSHKRWKYKRFDD